MVAVRELQQSGLGGTRELVQRHDRLHARLRRRRRLRQPALDRRPARVPRVRHPDHRRRSATYEPRIYFGEQSPTYSIVGAPQGSKPVELDYPGGADNAQQTYTTFTGNGGPKLDNIFKRLVYALKFQDEQIVLSDAVNSDSQILYDRDPIKRVQKVAPYLTLDSQAYPAVVDGRVKWIIDGYTTSDQYPVLARRQPE